MTIFGVSRAALLLCSIVLILGLFFSALPVNAQDSLLLDLSFTNNLANHGQWLGQARAIEFVAGEGPRVDQASGFWGPGLNFDRSSRGGYYGVPRDTRDQSAGGVLEFRPTSFPSQFTLSFWFRPTAPNEFGRIAWVVADKFIDIYLTHRSHLGDGFVEARLFGEDERFMAYDTPIFPNQWYFLALSVDGDKGEASIYLAKDEENTFVREVTHWYRDTVDFENAWLRLGNVASGNRPYKGHIDQVQLRSGNLTPAEIEAIWQHQLSEAGR